MMAQPTRLPIHDNPHSPASDATDRSRLKTATTGIRKFSVNNSERPMMTNRKPTGKARPASARPPYRRKPGAACSAGPRTAMAARPPRETSRPPIAAVMRMSSALRSSRRRP